MHVTALCMLKIVSSSDTLSRCHLRILMLLLLLLLLNALFEQDLNLIVRPLAPCRSSIAATSQDDSDSIPSHDLWQASMCKVSW